MSRIKKKAKRNRIIYGILILIVVLLGLGSRKFSSVLPNFISNYSGDILWALMIFLMGGFIYKRYSTFEVGLYALVFSFLIEISQLYHAPWIDGIRSTELGGLVLGFGFLYSDLVCYSVGVIIGVLFEKFFIFKKKNIKQNSIG